MYVRFSGGAVAPWLAGKLGENVSIHAPFWMGAIVVMVAVLVLSTGRRTLQRGHAPAPTYGSPDEAEAVAVGDFD